ncbi:MAG TPA: branched-chain amino acid transaminase [Anaerolineae bacterium]|mgnify:CR=1 FL=1|nr:branched-chain amino acid transaminase [Anaerolineae bacterium]HOQ97564.1 branched-chain amino acid transaminase [Anaerolineae bacterium]HPL28795.1 branched-chain amino acid transaminase [Anaerolineae bacterium]
MATRYAFFGGAIVPIEQARVSIMTHTLNYGTGCFEGIRAYWNPDEEQLFIFRMPEHYERLHQSSHILHCQLPYTVQQLGDITIELLRREGFRQDTYIRPLVYKATEGIGVRLHNLEDAFALFALPYGKYVDSEEGCRACVSSWRRLDDNMIPPRAKVVGSYVNSALCKTEAALNGYDEAIVLDEEGHVSEGSAENLFMVRRGVLVTPGETANILEGITRATVMQLAREELGIETVVRPIDRTELYVADELFYCGTGVQIAVVTEVDHRPIGSGQMGPVGRMLRDLYFDIVRGRNAKYRHWCTPVYA